jgi:hypothetical protein
MVAKPYLNYKLNQLKARIKYTDEKINQLVFELYGLGKGGKDCGNCLN